MIELDDEPTHEAARFITAGLVLDLEGDRYADPNGDGTCNCRPGCDHYYSWEFEYVVVLDVGWEGPDTVVLTLLDHGEFGFPPDHEFTIVGTWKG